MTSIYKFKLIVYLLFLSPAFYAQDTSLRYCGSTEKYQELSKEHPEILLQDQMMRTWLDQYVKTHKQSSNQVYVIPLVFHIIHNYGSENISDAQIFDEIRILNEDYSKANPDTGAVIPIYQPLIANCQIQFKLAQLDPNGNCTTGIERIASFETNIGGDRAKLHDWYPSQYLNVWVVKQMQGGVAGYAYFPSATTGNLYPYDGVIILSNYIGSIGTSSPLTSRALTHEIGHTLSLEHPWGNTNSPGVSCGDDGINDTPPTKGWTTCNLSGMVCDTAHHVIENVQNYMEYSYCSKMFTEGQKMQMVATLNNSTADRNNLWSAANLAHTGVLNTPVLCSPHADFHGSNTFVCQGGTLTFTDFSWGGTVTNRTWYFQNGIPAMASSASPQITFNVPGWQKVSLVVSNDAGSDSLTREEYVFVSFPSPDYIGLHAEDFEISQNVQYRWLTMNEFNYGGGWSLVNTCGHSGSSCMRMDNYNNTIGATDDLISPAYDLSLTTAASISFWYSEASRAIDTSKLQDKLKVYASVNCGQSWTLQQTLTGRTLYSAGLSSTPYTANNPSLWSQKTIALPASLMKPNVRFKFEFTSGTNNLSNNLYLDDVEIEGVQGIENSRQEDFHIVLQPNPATDLVILKYTLPRNELFEITLTDLLGKQITLCKLAETFGEHELIISSTELGLSKGMYFVKFSNGLQQSVNKLIFQ